MKLIIAEILTADRIPLMKVVISPNYEHFCYKEIIDFVISLRIMQKDTL